MSGVQPGGIAAGGADVWEACAAYRKAFVGVLADIASSVGDFREFRTEAARLLAERDDAAFEDWTAAVEGIRTSRIEWRQMQQLPVKPAAMTPSLTVTLKSEMTPADNSVDDAPDLATAA